MTESFVAGDRISGPDGSTGTIICGPDSEQDVVVRWDDHTRWPLEYSAEHVYALNRIPPETFEGFRNGERVRHSWLHWLGTVAYGAYYAGTGYPDRMCVVWDDHAPELFTTAQAREDVRHLVHCTASDDGMLRTHDDAAALLRSLAIGARVDIQRPLPGTARDSTRAYQIRFERYGRDPVITSGMYSLPTPAERLTTYLRGELERAHRGL